MMLDLKRIARTQEQILMLDTLIRVAEKYRDYYISKVDNGEFPYDLWSELAKLGYLGLLTPEEYGGTSGS